MLKHGNLGFPTQTLFRWEWKEVKDSACDLKGDWSGIYTERIEELHFKHRSILIPLPSVERHSNFTLLGERKLSYLTIPVLQLCFSWGQSGREENEQGGAPIPRLTVWKVKIACYMGLRNPDWGNACNETSWQVNFSDHLSYKYLTKHIPFAVVWCLLTQHLSLWKSVPPGFPAVTAWKGHQPEAFHSQRVWKGFLLFPAIGGASDTRLPAQCTLWQGFAP